MQERPPRRRRRGSRGRGGQKEQRPLPTRAPAPPQPPRERQRDRATPRSPAPPGPAGRQRDGDRASQGGRQKRGDRTLQRRPRIVADDLGRGAPCVIVLDCRDGEPDRTGATATFEGYFDFETGDPRRMGAGIPRLRIGDERVWGFECWWRPDPNNAGLIDQDRVDLETAKRMLRGLMRDARRSGRMPAPRPA